MNCPGKIASCRSSSRIASLHQLLNNIFLGKILAIMAWAMMIHLWNVMHTHTALSTPYGVIYIPEDSTIVCSMHVGARQEKCPDSLLAPIIHALGLECRLISAQAESNLPWDLACMFHGRILNMGDSATRPAGQLLPRLRIHGHLYIKACACACVRCCCDDITSWRIKLKNKTCTLSSINRHRCHCSSKKQVWKKRI